MQYEAVRLCVKKLEQVTVNVEARSRRMVAVDETKIKADGEWCYVWAAIEWIHVSFSPYGFHGRGT
jgi:transposase-like protein